VRAAFGDDALILGSRCLADGVEIIAALEIEPPPVFIAPAPIAPAPIAPTPIAPARPPEDSARMAALRFHAVPNPLQDALRQGALDAALAQAVPFSPLPLSGGEPPLLLVGPPGSGKTLTTVRLATRLVIAGAAPMVVTADGQRAGATEQLAAFTRLLRINLIVASHPVSLSRAMARRPQGAAVLIDAPGSNPFDPADIEALRTMASAAGACIALVLPAGLDPYEATDLAQAYAESGAALLIATRLDLARRVGGILAAAAAARLPLAEAGIGPGAADGMVPLTPAWLADRLMQTERPKS
jgi:flagellar biosynthesis protein FlhF